MLSGGPKTGSAKSLWWIHADLSLIPCGIGSIPEFTGPAAALRAAIVAEAQNQLLSNVRRRKCRHAQTICNSTDAVNGGDLLPVGSCSACHGDAACLVELSRKGARDDRFRNLIPKGFPAFCLWPFFSRRFAAHGVLRPQARNAFTRPVRATPARATGR